MKNQVSPEDLKEIEMFKDSPYSALKQLAKIVVKQDCSDEQEIFAEGSEGDSLYIVASGEVIIRKRFETQENVFKELAYISKGEFFGELSLIDKLKRSAQAVAHGSTSVYSISRKDFQKLMLSSPKIAVEQLLSFLRTISQRLRLSNSHLITVYEIGLLISKEKSVAGISSHVLNHVKTIVGGDSEGMIALWNPYNGEFDVKTRTEEVPEELSSAVTKEDFRTEISKASEGIIINGSGCGVSFDGSLLVSPFFSQEGSVSGFLAVFSPVKERFNLNHRLIISTVSSLTSLALINAWRREEEELRQRLKRS